jgi:hypothetical protein
MKSLFSKPVSGFEPFPYIINVYKPVDDWKTQTLAHGMDVDFVSFDDAQTKRMFSKNVFQRNAYSHAILYTLLQTNFRSAPPDGLVIQTRYFMNSLSTTSEEDVPIPGLEDIAGICMRKTKYNTERPEGLIEAPLVVGGIIVRSSDKFMNDAMSFEKKDFEHDDVRQFMKTTWHANAGIFVPAYRLVMPITRENENCTGVIQRTPDGYRTVYYRDVKNTCVFDI